MSYCSLFLPIHEFCLVTFCSIDCSIADVVREEVSQFLRRWPKLSRWSRTSSLVVNEEESQHGDTIEALVRCAAEYRHPVLDAFLEDATIAQKSIANFKAFLFARNFHYQYHRSFMPTVERSELRCVKSFHNQKQFQLSASCRYLCHLAIRAIHFANPIANDVSKCGRCLHCHMRQVLHFLRGPALCRITI